MSKNKIISLLIVISMLLSVAVVGNAVTDRDTLESLNSLGTMSKDDLLSNIYDLVLVEVVYSTRITSYNVCYTKLLRRGYKMEKIIATVLGIVIVLGLISYAILGQAAGIRDLGDNAKLEQKKISLMIKDANIVTGGTVLDYVNQGGSGLNIYIYQSNNTTEIQPANVIESAIFKMT